MRRQRAEARQELIDTYAAQFYDPDDIIQAAVTGDTQMVEEFQAIQASAVFPRRRFRTTAKCRNA